MELKCDVGSPSERVDCGYPGISRTTCLSRGCCWDTSVPDVSWCFHGKHTHDMFLLDLLEYIQDEDYGTALCFASAPSGLLITLERIEYRTMSSCYIHRAVEGGVKG